MNTILVPSMIDGLIINKVTTSLNEGLSIAITEYTGRGRLEEAKNYMSSCNIYDSRSGDFLMQLSGLRYVKLDTASMPDPHTFDRVSWKPDVSFLTQDKLAYLSSEDSTAKVDQVVDLIAHKKPALKVLEINLDETDSSCAWFASGDSSSRAAYLEYAFTSANAMNLIGVQTKHGAERNSSFHIMNPTKESLGLPESTYDLVIVKTGDEMPMGITVMVQNIKSLISDEGYVLLVKRDAPVPGSGSSGREHTPGTSSPNDGTSLSDVASSRSSISEVPICDDLSGEKINGVSEADVRKTQLLESNSIASTESQAWNASKFSSLMAGQGFGSALQITAGRDVQAYLFAPEAQEQEDNAPQELCVARLSEQTPTLSSVLRSILETSGWKVTEQIYPFQKLAPTTTILVLDELFGQVLTQANAEQWEALKSLITPGNNLLWVTKGAQYKVTDPNTALAHGLFRVIRMEDANAKLTTLDVQSSTSPATGWAIDAVLRSLRNDRPKTFAETEYAERDGILYVHRVVPDSLVNDFKSDEKDGAAPVLRSLHGTKAQVSLRAERLGTFLGLTWCETATSQVPVEPGKIEVEIMAAGVNFKVYSSLRLISSPEQRQYTHL
jgi:hypothetical protein